MAKVFQPDDEETGSLASLNKRVSQIPAGGAAPAYDGRGAGNDFTRNANNSLNALGGMGVVSSVPLRAAQAANSGLGAIRNTAAPAMLANGVAGPGFIAGASGVAQVGGANLPTVINAAAPVAKSVNVALQEGALANQAAAATRSLGNASAGLGMMDGQQAPLAKPVTQAEPVQQRTVAAGAIPFKSDAAAMFRNTREADKAITGVTGVTAQPTSPQVQVKTPAELHQEKLAAAQASQGAYAAIPKRGEYSEANTQAYLAALDKSKAMQPSYYSQETPNGAQNRAQADQAANAALANIDSVAPQRPAGALPANPAAQPVNPAQQAAATVPPPTAAQPADSNAIVTSENQRRNASELKREFSNASVLARNPGGAVRKITDANGKVTGYSGGNVTGEVSMVDANGTPLRGNTRGISSMDTSAGYASDLRQLAEIQKGKDEQNANMQAQAEYAQNQVLQQKALQGNPAALALLKGRMASSDGRNAGKMTDQTTRRGQDLNAGAVRQTNQLAQDKFGLESQGVKINNEKDQITLGMLKTIADPKATPEQKAQALAQMQAMSGKMQSSQYDFAPGGQVVVDGQLVTQPGVIYNKTTGDVKTPGAQQQAKATPNAGAVAMLKSNPGMAAAFDAKYGAGASKQILGQ